ncbi:hypothetical protein [Paraclostridium sordellii]|jgi:hypothetical protein|uniref:hypothetical protein n=2 Tax=Paraclostridium sordellii TaxID=1505 RepID=UPI0005E99317|nr:hypothetical protein [Paeniclostridium sordellii]CEQ26987.1 Uncharacterised protein [[Clostridium] sordellii] [Paeniclostridium sordellii]DAU04090.1 MAG TPA: hypothetical protein [Caudoviricetes sp.]
MEVKNTIKKLEEIKIKTLQMIALKPKDKEVRELLNIVETTIKAFENEKANIKEVEAYGSIEVQIESYSFIRDERIDKGISVYKVDLDGLYEYIDLIKVCKKHLNSINNIEGLKELAIEWYMENIQNEKVVLKKEN